MRYIVLSLFSIFLFFGITLAQGTEPSFSLESEEAVTIQDLGVKEPTLLPNSPFYFLKEWGRGIQSFFIFDPTKKLELELRFVNEKAAEMKKLQEQQPGNVKAIAKALGNYEKAQARLKTKFERLGETSQNPNVDKLLDQLAEKTIKHEKLFEELEEKFKDSAEIQDKIKAAKESIEESAGSAAKKDSAEKFVTRLEKALVDSKGSELKHIRSISFLDRIEQKVPEEYRKSLEELREEFSSRLREDIEEFLAEKDPQLLRESLKKLPGDEARFSTILQELKEKATEKLAQVLNKAIEDTDQTLEAEKNIQKEAVEQIQRAKEGIQKLETKLAEFPKAPEAVLNILSLAKDHLNKAQNAFTEGKFGETFGQARSAEVTTRNGLRLLEEFEERSKEAEDIKAELKRELSGLELKLQGYEELVKNKGFTPDRNPEVLKLLQSAQEHLGFAKEAFGNQNFVNTKLHIEHVKSFLRELSQAIELQVRFKDEKERLEQEFEKFKERLREKEELKILPSPVLPGDISRKKEESGMCIALYDPVCGVDGKTYSNECFAKMAGVEIAYKGECSSSKEPPIIIEEQRIEKQNSSSKQESSLKPGLIVEPVPIPVTLEADDSGFYPSSEIRVLKGASVQLTFKVRNENVYYGGLEFRSKKFQTETVKPGGSTLVVFVADESFEFSSYWPLTQVKKATGRVIVK